MDEIEGGIVGMQTVIPDAPKPKRKYVRRGPSRGRPASRAETAPLPAERHARNEASVGDDGVEELERAIAAAGEGGERLTRQQRGDHDKTFDIPMQGRRRGWNYEWKTVRVNGQEIDASEANAIKGGGWCLVPRTDFPSLVPPGWKHPYIEIWGQRMYMRPQHLTDEANEEMFSHAYKQRQDKLRQAQVGDGGANQAPRVDRGPNIGMDIGIRPLL